jgi:arginine decarboxylase
MITTDTHLEGHTDKITYQISNVKPKTLTQTKMPLFEALVKYAKQDVTPFDVPGHKMGAQMTPFKMTVGEMTMQMDVNSMKELDLLSHPQSVIKEAQELAAKAFNGDQAFFLVNGTTVGIQTMVMSVVGPNDEILVPRNCHKSVMNALILSGAKPIFVQPEMDLSFGISHGISVERVEKALDENPKVKALLVTYPTYFGSLNQLKEICDIAHARNVVVIVDSAHGAHLPFMPGKLRDPLSAGADCVTYSMHKTGGSLTQSSIMVMQGDRISATKLQKVLNMLQSTSANYLLMSSIDAARSELALYGKDRYKKLRPVVSEAIEMIESFGDYEVLKADYVKKNFDQSYDWTKLVIRVNDIGLTGFEVYSILKEQYGIQLELAEGYVVMAVISTADTRESIQKLVDALMDVRKKYKKAKQHFDPHVMTYKINKLICSPRDAFYADNEVVSIDDAVGRISADSIMIYPPGIPLIIPGEEISEAVVQHYHYYNETLGNVLTEEKMPHQIKVLKA